MPAVMFCPGNTLPDFVGEVARLTSFDGLRNQQAGPKPLPELVEGSVKGCPLTSAG